MEWPSPLLIIALISAIGGVVFLATTVSGNNNWFMDRISSPTVYPGLLPIANAIGKDLMLDVSPQLHPSVFVGESANQIEFQHWLDAEIHCEDCLRLDMPNTGNKIGAAFSSTANYNFEEATKVSFYVMAGEEGGETFSFRAVGNDRDNGTSTNTTANDLFSNQEFALTSQNVTLNQSWNYFEMSLDGVQEKLTSVKYPFAFELEQARGDIIYIKGITYSNEPILDRYLLEAAPLENLTASMMAITTAPTNATELDVTLSDNATETINAPATVEFNASVANGEEPYSFDWDFKDGAMETDTDGNIAHTFATPGLYNVTVNVVDSLNNTGLANTLVDIAEDQPIDNQSAIDLEDNSTQESQPTTGALNITNTTSPATDTDDDNEIEEDTAAEDSTGNASLADAAEDEELLDSAEDANTDDNGLVNDTDSNNNTNTGTAIDMEEENSDANNSPPVGNAGNDLVGVPNGQVILDASRSSDPDAGDTILSYQWEQESGPTAQINDQASPTPIVTLPDIEEDSTIVFSLTVNDGSLDSEEEDTVSIFVDYTDQLASNVQQRIIKPSEIIASQWTPSGGCEGNIECLSDGSHATFVAAGTENTDSVNLYSFGEFSGEGTVTDPNSLVIERVVAEMYAKKSGNTGYVSFAVDDPTEGEHYFTPGISIGSNSFQKYYQVWDTNPVTGEGWTYDSLNSLVAGFKYDGGQSGVEISELQLVVSYNLPETEAMDPSTEADPASSNETDSAEQTNGGGAAAPEDEEEQNDENATNDVEDTAEDEPTIEPDSTNTGGGDVNEDEGDASSGESEE
jgi:PKD domain